MDEAVIVSALILLSASVACDVPIRTSVTPLAAVQREDCRSIEDVEVFHTSLPDEPYEEVALIRVTGTHGSPDGALLAWLKHRASDVCADAVVAIEFASQPQPHPLAALCHDCTTDVVSVARGVAIRFVP